MNFAKYKILLVVGVVIIFFVGTFVSLNASYFYKQINFYFNPPKVDVQPQSSQKGTGEPNQLSIPSLGITAPIVESENPEEKSFQQALMRGVVHYTGTAKAGQVGNMYLFGHSSDLALKDGDYKTVFALLPSIKNDAEINVSDQDGNIFTYVVVDQFVAGSTDVHLLDQNTNGEKRLTVQTSYPIGTALKRYIVVAKLKE